MGESNFLCSEYNGRENQETNEINSREWDHSCNTKNVAVSGKYLEEVDTFDTDGIQGRHIADYSEQRQPSMGMLPNYLLWGGV